MYVCVCEAVTDHEIQEAIDNGACSLSEVMHCTRAGTRCGTCRSELADMVAAATAAPSGRRHLDVLNPAFEPVSAEAA